MKKGCLLQMLQGKDIEYLGTDMRCQVGVPIATSNSKQCARENDN